MSVAVKLNNVTLSTPSEPDSDGETIVIDETLDEVQALNSALCYLCWINAESDYVEKFLQLYPEALLFEGASQESAQHIIEEQASRVCGCTSSKCIRNREKVLSLLDCDFQHFQFIRLKNRTKSAGQTVADEMSARWESKSQQVQELCRVLRGLRSEEVALRQKVLEAKAEKARFQEELVNVSTRKKKFGSTALYRLTCPKGNNSERSVLEYQMGAADTKMKTLEEAHTAILIAIRHARRNQNDLLRRVFSGCCRYACVQAKR